ncbi:hypothetical protein ACJX0J_010498 [Zea mays]
MHISYILFLALYITLHAPFPFGISWQDLFRVYWHRYSILFLHRQLFSTLDVDVVLCIIYYLDVQQKDFLSCMPKMIYGVIKIFTLHHLQKLIDLNYSEIHLRTEIIHAEGLQG